MATVPIPNPGLTLIRFDQSSDIWDIYGDTKILLAIIHQDGKPPDLRASQRAHIQVEILQAIAIPRRQVRATSRLAVAVGTKYQNSTLRSIRESTEICCDFFEVYSLCSLVINAPILRNCGHDGLVKSAPNLSGRPESCIRRRRIRLHKGKFELSPLVRHRNLACRPVSTYHPTPAFKILVGRQMSTYRRWVGAEPCASAGECVLCLDSHPYLIPRSRKGRFDTTHASATTWRAYARARGFQDRNADHR